jgi:uncharacterized membrane protein
MNVNLRRALIAAAVVVVVAFVTAGLAGNNQTGARAVVGDVAWSIALLGAVVVIGLAIAMLVRSVTGRSKQHPRV